MNIGIVNDLAICIASLRKVLTSVPEHRVIWIARNGQEAVKLCNEQTGNQQAAKETEIFARG